MNIDDERDFWNTFHDGDIVAIRNPKANDLIVEIKIRYLRAMFPEAGEMFFVTLRECNDFCLRPWDGSPEVRNVQKFASGNGLGILSADDSVPCLRIVCEGANLDLGYESSTVALD